MKKQLTFAALDEIVQRVERHATDWEKAKGRTVTEREARALRAGARHAIDELIKSGYLDATFDYCTVCGTARWRRSRDAGQSS